MTNLSGANLHNGAAVGPQGEGRDSPSNFPKYPAYKDSGVEWLGTVPAHWVLTPIKHLALLNPRKSDFAGDTEQLCSFVPMEKLKTGVVQLDEERPIEEVIGGYTYFEDGDVLQAKVTPCFENKNIAIAKGLTNGIGFGSSEINVLRPYQGVNAEYLYYRVQEDSYMSFCTSSMIGAGGLKRVPTDVINNFKIAAPTLCEQTQIARFLDHETARIDALIEEQQRLIELLKEKRQAVISHAVTKGLDPTVPMKDSGVEWLGEVPAHWVFYPIKHLARLNPKKSGFAGDTGQLCSFLPMDKLKTGVIVLDEDRLIEEVIGGYTYFEDGDVLQAKVTPCFENRNIAIAKGLTNGIGFGSSEINVLRPFNGVSAEYLYCRLQEESYMGFCTANMIGAGGLKRVPTDVVNNFKVALPELPEQIEIAKYLDRETMRINNLIEHSGGGVTLLQERRSALISAAVTGKIDVRGWQPPASTQAPELEKEAV